MSDATRTFGRVGDDDVIFYEFLLRYYDLADMQFLGYELVTQAGRENIGAWQRLGKQLLKEREEQFPGLGIMLIPQHHTHYTRAAGGDLDMVDFAVLRYVYGTKDGQ